MSGNRLVSMLVFTAGIVLILGYGNTEMAGGDLWWHLAAGRELVQTGSPWMVDDWSFTAHGERWLNHEWLAGLLYFAWFEQFGLYSLVYWKWLLILVTFGSLQYLLYRNYRDPVAAFVGAAIAVALAAPFLDLRPHLYSLAGYSLLLCLALERRPSRWLLALLFLLWVNLHGGFFFGLMALAVLLMPWREFNPGQLRRAAATMAIALAVTLLNPSGLEAFTQPLVYALNPDSPYRQLGEWHSPFRDGGIRAPLFFVFMWAPLLAIAYALPAVRQRTGVPWEGLLLTALTLAMALTSRRFIPLYGISLALLLAPLFAFLLEQIRSRPVHGLLALAVLVLALLRVMPYSFMPAPSFHYLVAEYSFPENTVDFMLDNDLSGSVFALYKWGGYLHWRTDGAARVFIDGRANTVYDDDTFYDYLRVLRSDPNWIEALEATGADFILWSNSNGFGVEKLEALQASGRWELLYRDAVSWLAARTELELQAPLAQPATAPLYPLTLAHTAALEGRADEVLLHAREVRREQPWQKSACSLEINALLQRNQLEQAADVLADCLAFFPTRFLP